MIPMFSPRISLYHKNTIDEEKIERKYETSIGPQWKYRRIDANHLHLMLNDIAAITTRSIPLLYLYLSIQVERTMETSL